MSHKHLLFRAEAREKVLRGATTLADAVRVTLGPKSKCVLIERKYGKPLGQMRSGTGNYGFDAARGQFVDLIEAGIVDPTKVVRMALENAVSVAGVLLLTEATLTEVPDPKAEVARGSGFPEE